MTRFIAIDPGTHSTGVALFDGPRLSGWWAVDAGWKDPVEVRIATIVEKLGDIMARHGSGVTAVVCERPMGIDSHRPAPELQVLVKRLRSWARQAPRRYNWTEYHPSTVLAAVRPRGLGRTASSKVALHLGVKGLYGDLFDPAEVAQDVTDAVAVGVCHLLKTHEESLLENQ